MMDEGPIDPTGNPVTHCAPACGEQNTATPAAAMTLAKMVFGARRWFMIVSVGLVC
jgi:hypothetical protein